MAEMSQSRPYANFNFLVDIGSGSSGAQAGFQEVSGLSLDVSVAEYRAGNYAEFSPIKVTTVNRVGDVTLRRGVIGTDDLWKWVDQVRSGDLTAMKTVTITLQDDARQTTGLTWKLTNARPIRYAAPGLNGQGNEVAIEELVLACERIDISA